MQYEPGTASISLFKKYAPVFIPYFHLFSLPDKWKGQVSSNVIHFKIKSSYVQKISMCVYNL